MRGKKINEVDNASQHLMNETAVFDHCHCRYLVIIYSSNRRADTQRAGRRGRTDEDVQRERESALISVNKGAGQL